MQAHPKKTRMSGVKMYEKAVKRREMENQKTEKSQAVGQYFNSWGRITSQHDHWAEVDKRKQADAEAKRSQELLEKEKNEQEEMEQKKQEEAEERKRSEEELAKPTSSHPSTESLQKVNDFLDRKAEEKRRLELEANLYKRQMNLSDCPIMSARSDHTAMAKMNWIDRQMQETERREEAEIEREKLQLRRQEEERKLQENLTKRIEHRESEIRELKQLQDESVTELKTREKECEQMHLLELNLERTKCELDAAASLLHSNSSTRKNICNEIGNFRRVKVLLKRQAMAVCDRINEDIKLLSDLQNNEHADRLRTQFQTQLGIEMKKLENIEGMYDSEAKHCLMSNEAAWARDEVDRQKQLSAFLNEQKNDVDTRMDYCVTRQKELVNVKEAHLKSIENLNERLENIFREQNDGGGGCYTERGDSNEQGLPRNESAGGKSGISMMSSAQMGQSPRSDAGRSDAGSTLSAPRYGRKKVCWN